MSWLICIKVKLCIKINVYDNNWSLDLYDYESCEIIHINHFLIYVNQTNCSLIILHNDRIQNKDFRLFYLMIQNNQTGGGVPPNGIFPWLGKICWKREFSNFFPSKYQLINATARNSVQSKNKENVTFTFYF